MKRSGFKRPELPNRPEPTFEYLRSKAPSRAVMARSGPPVPAILKSSPVRDEEYRRLVATLPCINCGVVGFSQCAHGPALGKGIKASDELVFPLCCDRPGVVGCHTKYDQYLMFPADLRRARAVDWARETRKLLTNRHC